MNTHRKYTDEERHQLIANLDIEVAHRTRQFESWLADRLENFTIHQEGLVSRIPRQVRSMTMREFGEKYQGNVQDALRGFQTERLVAAGADAHFGEIDKNARKRKWVEGVEAEMERSFTKDGESSRAAKSARMAPSPSPNKITSFSKMPGATPRKRLVSASNKSSIRTGSNTVSRIPPSPSPSKSRPPFSLYTSSNPRSASRPTSPTKRFPSSSNFNPSLPLKTIKFPNSKAPPGINGSNGLPPTIRLPRRDESMLSINGSPLANPYQFGIGWFKGIEQAEAEETHTLQSSHSESSADEKASNTRSKNSIIIRRDPSIAFNSTLNSHCRANSQSDSHTASQATTTSRISAQNTSLNSTSQYPTTHLLHETYVTPKPPIPRSFSALVSIPTKDGQVLEFDPLQTSPGAIDVLDGITASAKKQAKAEMGRLVQAAVDKWKIT